MICEVEKEVEKCVIEAADMKWPVDRIVGAGGGSSSPHMMRRLKEKTHPRNIYANDKYRHLVVNTYNNWAVDKDSLFTVLNGSVLCSR